MGNYYWCAPSAEELVGTAYKLSDYPEPDVDVWDENWDVLHLFVQYSNQWKMAMNGPIGLDMTVFHHALDRKRVPENEYDRWLSQLRVIEAEALRQIRLR